MQVDPIHASAPTESPARRFVRAAAPSAASEEEPRKAPALPDRTPRYEARSLLKFSVSAADVDAKFEIHEPTSTVTVTMYERETGEVLREVPSKHVLDVIASVTASGLRVDTTS